MSSAAATRLTKARREISDAIADLRDAAEGKVKTKKVLGGRLVEAESVKALFEHRE
jgi:hypothetical protein